jgi:DNA-directed RNA polymerase specialized sigma24 family protein
MTSSDYLRSAEVVLGKQHESSNSRVCLDKCLKRFTSEEISLILQVYGDQRDRNTLATFRGVTVAQLKKIRSRLTKCIRKCLDEIEENAL